MQTRQWRKDCQSLPFPGLAYLLSVHSIGNFAELPHCDQNPEDQHLKDQNKDYQDMEDQGIEDQNMEDQDQEDLDTEDLDK